MVLLFMEVRTLGKYNYCPGPSIAYDDPTTVYTDDYPVLLDRYAKAESSPWRMLGSIILLMFAVGLLVYAAKAAQIVYFGATLLLCLV